MQASYRDELHQQYSDMYKDAYGIRPRNPAALTWSEEKFHQEFEYLEGVIKHEMEEQRERERRMAEQFERRVESTIETGARDRETALRWIHAAEGSDGDDDFLCYLLGLRYGYFRKAV